MFPFKDDVPTQSKPVITVFFIVVNCLVFFFQQSLPQEQQAQLVYAFGAVPQELTNVSSWFAGGIGSNPLRTVFTSMFMHGGWFHLGGNMLYLWIFGNNVEDSMGHVRYVIFYLLAGIGAAAAQVFSAPDSGVPMIGASGAIAGVLGAYLILHPFARVYTLVIIIFFIRVIALPAIVVLGFWFLVQILNGLAAPAQAGVAWHAHIGGFVAGLLMIRWFQKRRRHSRSGDYTWQ